MNQNIGIVGLGYVGAVSAACLARLGHRVYGLELDKQKMERLQAGQAPFFEPGLEETLKAELAGGRLSVHQSMDELIDQLDIILICVGTPSRADGSHNYGQLARVFEDLAQRLRAPGRPLLVAVRSTVTPGTTASLGQQFFSGVTRARLAYNPEFLREGTAIKDFFEPALVVVGADQDEAAEQLLSVYADVNAPKLRMEVKAAEMVKGVCNAFHALKIAFANETGSLAARCGVDPEQLMKVICADTRLNISPVYLKPGFAFGGSCLPKDVRALNYLAETNNCQTPLYHAILPSNDEHLNRMVERVRACSPRRVGIVGLSFKSQTDDLRESPALFLAAKLAAEGFTLRAFDPDINPALLHGANLATLVQELPAGKAVLTDSLDELMEWADCLVLTKRLPPELEQRLSQAAQPLINVSRVTA